MKISDVVRHKGDTVVTVRSDATVKELLALLAEHRIGAVVVSDDDGAVNGIVSERDVVRHLHSGGAEVLDGPVGQIMTKEVHTCSFEDDLVELAGFAPNGGLRLKGGGTLPADFRHFTHGYSTTSHAAQGKTVDRGLLLLTEAGFSAANLKQAYVSNSRFRTSQAIYTTDARAARHAMQRHMQAAHRRFSASWQEARGQARMRQSD